MSAGILANTIDRLYRSKGHVATDIGHFSDQSASLPNIYFVSKDHANSSDLNDGRDPLFPLDTIQKAVDKCVSDHGDIIIVGPGTYAENVVITSKNYISIIGEHAAGYARPDVVPATGIALVVNLSHGVVVEHMRFSVEADADVVRNEGNGFVFRDCVFDGVAAQGATKALLRLWCDAADDGYTASEGLIEDCLFRASDGYGIAADVQDAAVGVGPTHNVVRECRFISNVAEDVIALETAAGTYSMQDWLFDRCFFGMGAAKNKATHIDIQTNNGATNTGNVFANCFINDDTVDTTAIKAAGTASSFIGCYGLDGVIDGDALD